MNFLIEGSPAYSFSKEDARKIVKGFLIALTGAGLTYLANTIPNVNFGASTPIVVALFSAFVNAGLRFTQDNR